VDAESESAGEFYELTLSIKLCSGNMIKRDSDAEQFNDKV